MAKKGSSGVAVKKKINQTAPAVVATGRPSALLDTKNADAIGGFMVATGRPSALLDTRVAYCGDNLEQLAKLPDACVDLIYIDPAPVSEAELPFNSNRNYEVFWGETKTPPQRSFEDRHASTQTYIVYMRPRCVQLARVLKAEGFLLSLRAAVMDFPKTKHRRLWKYNAIRQDRNIDRARVEE